MFYGYATGVFSSHKLERATYDSVAFRFIAANDHPDHDTIASFRRRFLPQIEKLFVQILLLAREMGVLKLGTVGLDGTKVHANASRHSALSYEHAGKIEAQLKAAVAGLMAKAEAADTADIPDGMPIPDELALREKPLQKLAEARAKMEARAQECFAQADAGAGVRHHQIRVRLPAVFHARPRQGARRMEPRDERLEHQADVHAQIRAMREIHDNTGAAWAKRSVHSASRKPPAACPAPNREYPHGMSILLNSVRQAASFPFPRFLARSISRR